MDGAPHAPRKIIHLDLDAFFCSVEELRDPALRGKVFAVGGRPESRGVVASCSYPARRLGIHSAMPMSQAVRRAPDLVIVPARHGEYGAVSRQVMQRLHALTPLVEQLSIDEAFLDVTARAEPPEEIARRLQQTIRSELQLPCSLGVASNKLVAKIANNVGKAAAQGAGPPNAILVVPPGQEAEFLAPLPCAALWGVGPKTAERLRELGLHTIGDIAAWPEADLLRRFGKHGYDLARHARGLDDRPVIVQHERKSVSQETTFERDVADGARLRHVLHEQAAEVARILQRKELRGATVKIKVRWSDFTTLTRQVTLRHLTADTEEIGAAARELFDRLWEGQPVRLLGVGVSGLGEEPQQIGLWDSPPEPPAGAAAGAPDERRERLVEAVSQLRARFGDQAVRRASDL
jgi:DNA polymerase-4